MTIHKPGTKDCQPFCRPTELQFMLPPMSHRILPCWDGKFFFPVPSLLSHLMMPQYRQYMLLSSVSPSETHTTASEPHFRHQQELKRRILTNVLSSKPSQLVNSSGCTTGLSLVFGRPIVSSLNCGRVLGKFWLSTHPWSFKSAIRPPENAKQSTLTAWSPVCLSRTLTCLQGTNWPLSHIQTNIRTLSILTTLYHPYHLLPLCLSLLGRDALSVLLFATVCKSVILSVCSLLVCWSVNPLITTSPVCQSVYYYSTVS